MCLVSHPWTCSPTPDKYVKLSQKEEDQTEAILQIKLTKEKKDQIMRMLFGHENIEFA